MNTQSCIALLLLLPALAVFAADDAPPTKEPAAAVIDAWKKAGGQYGGMKIDSIGERMAVDDRTVKPGQLPAFSFFRVLTPLKKLPPLEVPFGLEFLSPLTDAQFAEIVARGQPPEPALSASSPASRTSGCRRSPA